MKKILAVGVDQNFWFLVYTNDELTKEKSFSQKVESLLIFQFFFHFLH